jgi:hypothetical protein
MSDTPRTDRACQMDAGSFRKPKWKNLLNESRNLEKELTAALKRAEKAEAENAKLRQVERSDGDWEKTYNVT